MKNTQFLSLTIFLYLIKQKDTISRDQPSMLSIISAQTFQQTVAGNCEF